MSTKIEWTDERWNPVRGCSRVSEGCRNCYAERIAGRFSRDAFRDGVDRWSAGPFRGFARRTSAGPRWTGRVELIPEKLDEPLHWLKPRRVFVNSMSDLFHEALSDEAIARVFGIMRQTPWHDYQILTKRPKRMREWVSRCADGGGLGWITHNGEEPERAYRGNGIIVGDNDNWPLVNVWLGVSCEDQRTADERIPVLLQTPAAVHFVSLEPLLGPVDLVAAGALAPPDLPFFRAGTPLCSDRLCGRTGPHYPREAGCRWGARTPGIEQGPPGLDWIIVGGESGPGARPCDVSWIRSIVRQCREAAVPCFVKQLGAQPFDSTPGDYLPPAELVLMKHPKGGDPSEWPEDLRAREWPA